MDTNKLTLRISKFLDILTALSPLRTALGGLTGVAIFYFSKLFFPLLKDISFINFSSIDIRMCAVLGIFVLHSPTILKSLFSAQKFSPEIETAFDALRELRRQGAPKTEINLLCRKICDKVLLSVETPKGVSRRSATRLGKDDPDAAA